MKNHQLPVFEGHLLWPKLTVKMGVGSKEQGKNPLAAVAPKFAVQTALVRSRTKTYG
jgi:hypothetical protein